MIDVGRSHLATVTRILADHVPECEVRVFGSRVAGTAKHYSDLDLALIGHREIDWDTLRQLREAFEESDLPFRVDVIDWHAISEGFRKGSRAGLRDPRAEHSGGWRRSAAPRAMKR